MTPVLVTAPSGAIVTLADMKLHLRVTHDAEDGLISALTTAAVAYLDGWTGVLGRCIGAQVWRVTLSDAGTFVLPMPDVTVASADYGAGAVALDVVATSTGPSVEVTGACDVTFTCDMSEPMAALVATVVKLMVGHWYENREAAGPSMQDLPMGVDMIISAIRWRQV